MNINKFVNPEQYGAPFHSSGYAEAAGKRIGAVSAETFRQRRAVDRNRQMIGKYGDASIVNNYHRPAPVAGESYQRARGEASAVNPRQGFNARSAVPPPRQAFREPPSRSFNPYS